MNYTKHTISEDDKRAVVEAMDSMLTQGEQVERFEDELAAYCGAKFAVACCNGTAALWMAYKAVGLLPWDTAVIPTMTFVATANMVEAHLANTVFVDCTQSGHMIPTLDRIEAKMVVPVHMAGDSCDMARLWETWGAESVIVEDACHALGASYNGSKVGACEYSDMACFSFHPSKSITTAEGGAVTTNNRHIYSLLKQARNHGFIPGTHKMTDCGFNFRLSELHAALGRSQLRRIDSFIERRREICKKYAQALDGMVTMPIVSDDSSHHLFVVRTPKRDQLKEHLAMRGINAQIHYKPVHQQPYWDCGDTLRGADQYYKEALSLPLYPSMSDEDIERVVSAVEEVMA